jgi:cytochrome c553
VEGISGGDAQRGKDLYTTCVACHGERGQGQPAVAGPPLVGQHGWYLLSQLQNFRQGIRGADPADQAGHLMANISTLLPPGEQTAQDLVAYIMTLK